MANAFKLTNNIAKLEKELLKEDRQVRSKAARYVAKAIRNKLKSIKEPSLPGQTPGQVTGNLIKGIGTKNFRTMSIVGIKAPGYHAHLLEFGTDKMAARPFLFSTFAETAPEVKRILSQERLK